MFNAIRGALASGATKSFLGSTVLGRGSGWRHAIGSDLLRGTGNVVNRMAGMSNAGLSAVMGGVAGGVYGGFSDNTSVLGGALMGAGLGAGGYGASRLGRMGYSAFKNSAGSTGQRAMQSLYAMGGMSRAFIGNALKSNGAINSFGASIKKSWSATRAARSAGRSKGPVADFVNASGRSRQMDLPYTGPGGGARAFEESFGLSSNPTSRRGPVFDHVAGGRGMGSSGGQGNLPGM